MILILGKSTLSIELKNLLPTAEIAGRPDYDFSKEEDCLRLVEKYTPTVLINTVGVLNDDIWNMLVTNYVSVVYTSLKFYEKNNNLQIINISSAASHWVSYPDIDINRLCYNISKESLTNFGCHMARKTVNESNFVISTIEPGKFPSKINNFDQSKFIAADVAQIIKNVIGSSITRVSMAK
jgi:hypothetical protein